MKNIKKSDLSCLLGVQKAPCVSMYLDGTRGLDSPEGIGRFRSELKRAAVLLATQYRRDLVVRVLAELRSGFLDAVRSRPRAHLALFASPDFSGFVHHALPPSVRTVVAPTFHVRPLLAWMDESLIGTAMVARHGELQIWRLFAGEPELESLQSADGLEALRQRLSAWKPAAPAPLVFVGAAPYVVEMARRQLHHPAIPLLTLEGSPTVERWLPRAEEFVSTWLEKRSERILNEYLLGRDTQRTSASLPSIARLLRQGGIEAIIVNRATNLWGTHDEDFTTVNVRPAQRDAEDDDLLDDIVEEALRRKVPLVEVEPDLMPHARWRPVVALVRSHAVPGREFSLPERAQALLSQGSRLVERRA